MQEGLASRTAHRVALRRAAHQILDDPKIFDDPIALRIVEAEDAPAAQEYLRQNEAASRSPALRTMMVVRSRIAEDALHEAVAAGVRQYVILGAGLDTFAYRNPYPADRLRVFEVDHPATQAWKRAHLARTGIAVPASLVFAAVDFEQQTLADGLATARFAADQPAFFSWLGVVPYLTTDAVLATLAFVASLPRGSGIAFDYPGDPADASPERRAAHEALRARVARAGEPFRSSFRPDELAAQLRALGFSRLIDEGSDEMNARWCAGRSDGLVVAGLSRMMRAWV